MLIANKPFTYAGRRLHAGDEFDARGARDEKLLTAIKHASQASQPAQASAKSRKPRKGTYERRDMIASDLERVSVPTITGEARVPGHLAESAFEADAEVYQSQPAIEPDSDA